MMHLELCHDVIHSRGAVCKVLWTVVPTESSECGLKTTFQKVHSTIVRSCVAVNTDVECFARLEVQHERVGERIAQS